MEVELCEGLDLQFSSTEGLIKDCCEFCEFISPRHFITLNLFPLFDRTAEDRQESAGITCMEPNLACFINPS